MSTAEKVEYGVSVAALHNERNRITLEIEKLIKPFQERWQLNPNQIHMEWTYHGCLMRITL
jgi:hypothetical protein